MDLGILVSARRLGPAAVDPAALRLPCRAVVRALRRRRHRARRQDAGRRLRRGGGGERLRDRLGRACCRASSPSVAFALVHGFACITQRGNQIVSGVAINMLAAGLTAVLGNAWYGAGRAHAAARRRGSAFADLLFGHSLLVYLALARGAAHLRSSWQRPASACACARSARTRPRSTPPASRSPGCAMRRS